MCGEKWNCICKPLNVTDLQVAYADVYFLRSLLGATEAQVLSSKILEHLKGEFELNLESTQRRTQVKIEWIRQ